MAFNPGPKREEKEFSEKVIQVNRVSKKTKGGNRIAFSVLVVIGDKKGKVGAGSGKARDVSSAIKKALKRARKNLFKVTLKGKTIPHQVFIKRGAAKVLIKPAPPGTGLIAGSAIRTVASQVGIEDLVSKILGTRNKASNVYAAIEALKKFKFSEKKHQKTLKKPEEKS
jgi:small subunit ribosomal protein S5